MSREKLPARSRKLVAVGATSEEAQSKALAACNDPDSVFPRSNSVHESPGSFKVVPAPVGAVNQGIFQRNRRRGATPKFDWPEVEQFVFQKMDEEGDFREWDTEWKCQADLERAVSDYVASKYGASPAESTIRSRIGPMLDHWRQHRRQALIEADKGR
jgi:hypothetical protein